MGYEPIGKLIMKLSLPLMLSMLIQALYNVVDSIFVSRVSELALTAVSLAFPLQNLMIAFSIGTAVGVNSYLARKLGEGNTEQAEKAADTGNLPCDHHMGGICSLRHIRHEAVPVHVYR